MLYVITAIGTGNDLPGFVLTARNRLCLIELGLEFYLKNEDSLLRDPFPLFLLC